MSTETFLTASAKRVLETLDCHTPMDVVKILTQALSLTVNGSGRTLLLAKPVRKKQGRKMPRCNFLKDHELMKFIRGYDRERLYFMKNEDLRYEIAREFGGGRTPSKSALGRFLTDLRRSVKEEMEEKNHVN